MRFKALHNSLWLAAVVTTLLALPLETHADVLFRELSNSELQSHRGRYRPADTVQIFFGLKMETQWQTAEGNLYQGGLHFSLDNALTPTTQFYAYEAKAGSENESATVPDPRGGLSQVVGVAQSHQVAGNSNSSRNSLRIQVTDDPAAQQAFTQSSPNEGQAQAGTAVTHHASGSQLGVEINTGRGTARQGIFGSQITQAVWLQGDNQTIRQSMDILFIKENRAITAGTAMHHAVSEALKIN